jgi:hypothetical protein
MSFGFPVIKIGLSTKIGRREPILDVYRDSIQDALAKVLTWAI